MTQLDFFETSPFFISKIARFFHKVNAQDPGPTRPALEVVVFHTPGVKFWWEMFGMFFGDVFKEVFQMTQGQKT